jgi:hypothetical protein
MEEKEKFNFVKFILPISRSSFEVLGILTAVCALFLAIPLPEAQQARESLLMVQFLSIFALSLATVFFTVVFVFLAEGMGNEVDKKLKLELSGTLVFLSFAFFGLLIFNLWKYMISLYSAEWKHLMYYSSYALGTLLGSLSSYAYPKIYDFFPKRKLVRFFLTISIAALIALIAPLWNIVSDLSFKPEKFLQSFLLFFTLNMVFFLIFLLARGYDKKHSV